VQARHRGGAAGALRAPSALGQPRSEGGVRLRPCARVVFFSFVIDVFSRRIVGWQFAPHMRTGLVLDALRRALGRRRGDPRITLVHHSDAGSQLSADYTQELTDHRILGSIGSVGDACDNALAESFVNTFKTELITDRVWRARSQLELAIVEYVGWFNTARLHESLGDIPPSEFEALHAPDEPALHRPRFWGGTLAIRSL
jgi:putative transposase